MLGGRQRLRGVLAWAIVLAVGMAGNAAGAIVAEGTPVIEDPADDGGLPSVDNPLDPSFQVGPVGADVGDHEDYPHETPRGPFPDRLDLREVRLSSDSGVLTVQIEAEHLDEDIPRSYYSMTFRTSETGDRVHEAKCLVGDHVGGVEGSLDCWVVFETAQTKSVCTSDPCYEEEMHSDVDATVAGDLDTLQIDVPYGWLEAEPGLDLVDFGADTWWCTSAPAERLPVGVWTNHCEKVDQGNGSGPYTLS